MLKGQGVIGNSLLTPLTKTFKVSSLVGELRRAKIDLKIVDVRVYPLGYVEREPWERIRNFALIEVSTNTGITGIGEASDCYGHSFPRVVSTIVEDVLKRHLIDEDPLSIERLLRKMATSYQHFGMSGPIVQAISGVEIALWDILGKEAGLPLYKLLGGGTRESVPVYAGGPLDFTRPAAECSRFYSTLTAKGMKAVKVRIGNNPDWDEEFVRETREVVGKDTKIMVDGFMNFSPQAAIRTSKMLAKYDVFYFEEPIVQGSLATLREVREKSEVPIAVGEHLYLSEGFMQVIDARAVDYLTPDVTVCGGISECMKIFSLASASGVPIVQHCGGLSAIGIAANLHALCAQDQGLYMEYDAKPFQPMRDELLTDPFLGPDHLVGGALPVPREKGLGISLRNSLFEKYQSIKLPPQKSMPTYGMGLTH